MAVGTRWEMKRDRETNVAIPHLIQSTMQIVPITKTLTALFKNEEFRAAYFEGNSEKSIEGEYKSFRDGEIFKSNILFSSNPDSIQIHLATDDAELCAPLLSRGGVHKGTFVYIIVENVPKRFVSKLNNIYLVCLCNTDDLKTKQTDFNNIWEVIVRDLEYLENVGIEIGDGVRLKGTISQLSFDNLGGQISLGLAEGFNTAFYCRICECGIEECKTVTKEDKTKYRNKENYLKQLEVIASLPKVDFKKTQGIKRYCMLNNLRFFNIFKNMTIDVMHDITEGTMAFLQVLYSYKTYRNKT